MYNYSKTDFSLQEKIEQWDGKYEPETKDQMLADAVPVPTPAICPEATTCGFQPYDDATTGQHNHTFVRQ